MMKLGLIDLNVKSRFIKSRVDLKAKYIATKEKPSTLKCLLGWLGAANYLRRYIPNYAQVTQPLYNLVDQKKIPKSLRKKKWCTRWKKDRTGLDWFSNRTLCKTTTNFMQWVSTGSTRLLKGYECYHSLKRIGIWRSVRTKLQKSKNRLIWHTANWVLFKKTIQSRRRNIVQ